MATHALVTGTGISGRIPFEHPDHPEKHLDVTPEVIYFEGDDGNQPPPVVKAAADAIEAEHYFRGTHPIQQAARALPADAHPDSRKNAAKAVADLDKRFGGK
jgi:hypothetical protein